MSVKDSNLLDVTMMMMMAQLLKKMNTEEQQGIVNEPPKSYFSYWGVTLTCVTDKDVGQPVHMFSKGNGISHLFHNDILMACDQQYLHVLLTIGMSRPEYRGWGVGA